MPQRASPQETEIYIEFKENETNIYQNMTDVLKTVLIGKYIKQNAQEKMEKNGKGSNKLYKFLLKKRLKAQIHKKRGEKKEIIKIR